MPIDFPSPASYHGQRSTLHASRSTPSSGFTLIELLVVIAVISILAALIFPVGKAVNRAKVRSKARVELTQIASAIENYKSKLGYYPPDNPVNMGTWVDYRTNQLYYELSGTTGSPAAGFNTLAGDAFIANVSSVFLSGVTGFANCSHGSGDEGHPALNFLKPQLALAQVATNDLSAKFIVCSIPSPQTGLKPWVCYNSSSPAHNKNGFDLWIDVVIDNQVNRICNWSDRPIIGATTYP